MIGIYFLRYKKEIVYVGQSTNIGNRILAHKHKGEIDFDDFNIMECKTEDLREYEKEQIAKHNPKHNIYHRTDIEKLIVKKPISDTAIALNFNMPLRTYTRFKKDEDGGWRKKIYYLMLEEMLRIEKLKG